MAKTLYISLTGMTEALGESQVVQYLVELAKHNEIVLLSFEKPCEKIKYTRMQKTLSTAGIQWKYFEYSNRFGVFSTLWQILSAFFLLSKIIYKEKIQVVHTRSLIPATIGMLLKKLFSIKLLFDIRGFAIDEKIMDGRIKENSFLSRILKKLELIVYKNSDHVVTLTHASKPIIHNLYKVDLSNITVIPTCANLELFKPVSHSEKIRLKTQLGFKADDFIVLHNGSLNNWVDFAAEIKLFEELAQLHPNIQFLFLNKGQHELILSYLEKTHLDKKRYQIHAADFNQVCSYLNLADLCVFFIKPSFAKLASAPTKFAELVACHLFSVTNTQYGDMEYYLKSYPVGLLLELPKIHQTPKKAAEQVWEFMQQNRDNLQAEQFDQLFSQHFSKQLAVQRYQQIYNDLTRECHESIAARKI